MEDWYFLDILVPFWSDDMNLNNQIIYQIYPKSFCDSNGDGIGDLKGIISKLDYLQDLGIDYLWLSPICVSPQKDNGYDIADYYHIDPMFGSDEDYFELIHEANKRGIKIMMDLVLNHVSSEHEWFKKAIEGDSYYQDFFIWRDEPNEIESLFGGTAWEYEEHVGKYYLHLFDTHQIDLNFANPNVRTELYKMINYWIDKGIQGFRLDVIDLIGKDVDSMQLSLTPKFYDYLHELHEQTFGDVLLTVGECWGAKLEDALSMCDGKGLTQVFHFEHLTTTNNPDKWHANKLDLNDLASVLEKWQNLYSGIDAIVMNNHDMPRLVSKWLDDETYRVESALLLVMLFGFMRGNLYIFQGEEYGMVNAHFKNIHQYKDVESLNLYKDWASKGISEDEILSTLGKVSRDNARIPMQFTSEEKHGFTTAIPWIGFGNGLEDINTEDEHGKRILDMYKAIIRFRKEHAAEYKGEISFKVRDNVLFFRRGLYVGVFNFSDVCYELRQLGETVFHNYEDEVDELRAYEAYIYRL